MMYQNVNWRRSWFPVWYAFCPDDQAFRREMKRSTDPDCTYPDTDACCVHYDDDRGNRCCLVTIHENVYKNNEKYPLLIPGLVVHECVHILENVIRRMADDNPSEEFRAYSLQALFTEIMSDVMSYIERRKVNNEKKTDTA